MQRFASTACFTALVLVVGGLAAACTASQRLPPGPAAPLKAPAPAPGEYRLVIGDELEIQVWREPELRTQQRVLPDGTVAPILLDPVPVNGQTVPEIRATLTEAYKSFLQEPRVSVRVVNMHDAKVFVLGEVGSPGVVAYEGRMTVLQALAEVGGVNDKVADKSMIRIVRTRGLDCPKIYSVNMRNVLVGCACSVEVTAGDILYVHPTELADWSDRFSQALKPFNDLLGAGSALATVIIAAEAVR